MGLCLPCDRHIHNANTVSFRWRDAPCSAPHAVSSTSPSAVAPLCFSARTATSRSSSILGWSGAAAVDARPWNGVGLHWVPSVGELAAIIDVVGDKTVSRATLSVIGAPLAMEGRRLCDHGAAIAVG